jgi:S1-C subfamily serine protease
MRKLRFLFQLSLLGLVLALFGPGSVGSSLPPLVAPSPVFERLQNSAVTIRSPESQGSGVLVRKGDVSYVLTCGHVVDGARHEENGVVTFEPLIVIDTFLDENGTLCRNTARAIVVRYSDADAAEDIALLRIEKTNFSPATTEFYLETNAPPVGTDLIHVGSLMGEQGADSAVTGIVAALGRIRAGKIFDQTTVPAYPGSSGGGVYLTDGRYVGMLTQGIGPCYNFIVPIRRIHAWAVRAKAEFIFNDGPVTDGPLEDKPATP